VTDNVGTVEVQGEQPSNIINVAFTPKQTDGGKARILRKRDNFRFRIPSEPTVNRCDDLTMDHADNGMPSDSAYCAPEWDPA